MNKNRRAFLRMAGAAALAAPAVRVMDAQNSSGILVPHASWDCGMKDGISNPDRGVLLFEAKTPLQRLDKLGKTPYGERRVAIGTEGAISGPKLSGKVMTGALDYELTLSNGVVEVESILVLQTDDGKYIYSRSGGVGPDMKDVRIAMDFEAPNGSAAEWLNNGKYVARRILDESAKMLTLRIYDVAGVTGAGQEVRITKPAGAAPQPWGYRQKDASEKPGKELIVESVGLSPSQRVGASKRGNRNIIPITGGDLSGRITGKVLAGGADFQNLSGGGPAIDARYLWQASDGELIIVRNTTSAIGGLVPIFETRVDGPYAYLNTGKYLSSNPGIANGGVKITMYDSAN